MQINFGSRSVSCKIVYCGPGLSGKTTNIQKVHELTPAQRKSDLTSIKTEGDRTLFFDFMSLDLGKVAGMDTRFQLYTVPGQVFYNATRKLVIQGADGIVFVADSSPDRLADNIESWMNLQDNLAERGLDLRHLPVVMQWNKRDVAGAVKCDELDRQVNSIGAPTFEAVACSGDGVLETLKCICGMVCKTLNAKQMKAATEGKTHAAAAASPATAGASAQSMSFASRRVVASAGGSGATASAVLDRPAQAIPEAPPAVAPAPTPPRAKPREVEPVTAHVPVKKTWSAKETVILAASVAAVVAGAWAAAWVFGIL